MNKYTVSIYAMNKCLMKVCGLEMTYSNVYYTCFIFWELKLAVDKVWNVNIVQLMNAYVHNKNRV